MVCTALTISSRLGVNLKHAQINNEHGRGPGEDIHAYIRYERKKVPLKHQYSYVSCDVLAHNIQLTLWKSFGEELPNFDTRGKTSAVERQTAGNVYLSVDYNNYG